MVLTWDLVLIVFFVASIIYGFLMGREKIIVTLLGAYVGLVIANQWAGSALGWLTDQSTSPVISGEWVSGNISIFAVKVFLFIGSLLIIALSSGLAVNSFVGGSSMMGLVIQLGYSLLSAALIAASIIQFLPDDSKNQLLEGSSIASILIGYYAVFLFMPVALMLVGGFLSRRE